MVHWVSWPLHSSTVLSLIPPLGYRECGVSHVLPMSHQVLRLPPTIQKHVVRRFYYSKVPLSVYENVIYA